MGTAVADREKKKGSKPQDAAKGEPKDVAEKVKYDVSVKLRAEFKEQLDAVADDLDLFPGELIELRLGQFVRTEWKRILTEKLKKAQGEE